MLYLVELLKMFLDYFFCVNRKKCDFGNLWNRNLNKVGL